jgi:hypothetical protein
LDLAAIYMKFTARYGRPFSDVLPQKLVSSSISIL